MFVCRERTRSHPFGASRVVQYPVRGVPILQVTGHDQNHGILPPLLVRALAP